MSNPNPVYIFKLFQGSNHWLQYGFGTTHYLSCIFALVSPNHWSYVFVLISKSRDYYFHYNILFFCSYHSILGVVPAKLLWFANPCNLQRFTNWTIPSIYWGRFFVYSHVVQYLKEMQNLLKIQNKYFYLTT